MLPLVTLNLNGSGGAIELVSAGYANIPADADNANLPRPETSVDAAVVLTVDTPLNPNGSAFAGATFDVTLELILTLIYFDLFGYVPVICNPLSDSLSKSNLYVVLVSPITLPM